MAIRSWSMEFRSRLASVHAYCKAMLFSRRKIATGAAALLAFGVGYHVVFGANGLTVYEQKRQETQVLGAQLQQLRHENERLKEHVDRLKNDPEAIEQKAREDLHYTRPGEVIYALPEERVEAANARSASGAQPQH